MPHLDRRKVIPNAAPCCIVIAAFFSMSEIPVMLSGIVRITKPNSYIVTRRAAPGTCGDAPCGQVFAPFTRLIIKPLLPQIGVGLGLGQRSSNAPVRSIEVLSGSLNRYFNIPAPFGNRSTEGRHLESSWHGGRGRTAWRSFTTDCVCSERRYSINQAGCRGRLYG